jgi:hypothetical protein
MSWYLSHFERMSYCFFRLWAFRSVRGWLMGMSLLVYCLLLNDSLAF